MTTTVTITLVAPTAGAAQVSTDKIRRVVEQARAELSHDIPLIPFTATFTTT